ncbi:MAG: uracil-DNA glycosylase [Phycisphaerae bacterium]|nr:uracil-DNA glycosylase [Phycisphaerae bacterium]
MDPIRKQLHQRLELEQMLGARSLPRPRRLREPAAAPAAPVAPVAAAASPAPAPAPGRAGEDPIVAALTTLEAEVKRCTKCRLCKGRSNVVFGEGHPHAPLVFVGEAPGADEDRLGRPFVGRAGQLLNDIITKGMGVRREDVYIANVCKCRPPENRQPAPDEMADCLPYLLGQLEQIHPRVVVALGATAAQGLLNTTEGVGRLRGQVHPLKLAGLDDIIPVVVTYHPAYLLRNYNPEARGKVWEDIQVAMKLAGIPIPKKKGS